MTSPARRGLLAAIALLLAVLPAAGEAGAWERRTGCRLAADDFNDGDSFAVACGGETFRVRLYRVDACETSMDFPERVAAQAAYFGTTPARALLLGKEAARCAEDFLRDGFEVASRGENAGNGRTYANVSTPRGDLGGILVASGLARIHGKSDGIARSEDLLAREEAAKRLGLGGWRNEEAWRSAERAAAKRTGKKVLLILAALLALALFSARPLRRRRRR